MITFRPTVHFDKSVTIILLTEEQMKSKTFKDFGWSSLEKELTGLAKSKQFQGKDKECFPLSSDTQLVLLVGLGKEADLNATAVRVAVRKAIASPYLKQVSDIECVPFQKQQDDTTIIAVIEGILIGGYAWTKYKKKQAGEKKKRYTIAAPSKGLYNTAIKACQGVSLARDLVNENADVADARFIEKTVRQLVKGKKNFSCEVFGKKELKAKGLRLHLAVNQGSNKEPKLIIVRYKGSVKKAYDLALVGKGITFDAGGLNIKSSGHIETMRTDMAGTAAVIGTLKNVLMLKPKKNILFVCAVAENVVGSGAYKPGDVIRSHSGKTVEIGNTDAEGRLVLADALSYVSQKYKPKRIIDLATLTGACIVALGYDYSGLLTIDDAFACDLIDSAKRTDDRAWRLPLYPELKGCMRSTIADIKNTSSIRGAGTITAAYFLQQFVNDVPWAHFDIAGSAFVEKGERLYFGHGATGAGVRLLTDFILTH